MPIWMAPHAKFFAVYPRLFWREADLSGWAQSMAGPLVDIHDATTSSNETALLGFIGMPAAQRKNVGQQMSTTARVILTIKVFFCSAERPSIAYTTNMILMHRGNMSAAIGCFSPCSSSVRVEYGKP